MKDMAPLTDEQIKRYSRHIILPEVGGEGQAKLLSSKILIVGMGGLGSPAALYLAAAGVGTLGLLDFDEVELSNLQRQIIHSTENLGKSKVQSARETLTEINPGITLRAHDEQLTSKNIMDVISDYDLIVDGSDNFPTRFLLNDACVLAEKTNVYGAVFRFEGQMTVFAPHKGPCLRCFVPDIPPPGAVPRCQEAGILGVLPGVIGTLQATEAIKILLGIGKPLIGRFLVFDALEMELSEFKLPKNPECPTCGKDAKSLELTDYQNQCNVSG